MDPGDVVHRLVITHRELVRALQERTARAVPAEHVERSGGWWLRHTTGPSWWAGTVLPHDHGDLPRRIVAAERFYADRGAVARFQITPGACPDDLDPLLAGRGYRRQSVMSLRAAETAVIAGLGPAPGVRVRVDDRPAAEWFDLWACVHGTGGSARAERELLGRVPAPCGFASAVLDGRLVAVGRVVADDGWAGVFGMATRPEARGRGVARAVLAAMATWAGAHAAGRMYLQMEPGQVSARRLYDRARFEEICRYHYRSSE